MDTKKRDIRIDIMKGIAIILMVYGHSGAPLKNFIYLFHMAVFFMISGYLFDEKKVISHGDTAKYIVKKIKSLWLIYFVWNTAFILLNNFFLKINFYTNNNIENFYKIIYYVIVYV